MIRANLQTLLLSGCACMASQSFSQTFGGTRAGADMDTSSGGVGMSNYAEEKGTKKCLKVCCDKSCDNLVLTSKQQNAPNFY